MTKQLLVEISGMTCSNCAKSVSSALSKLSSVKNSSVNSINNSALVDVDDNIDFNNIKEAVKSVGYKVESISEI